MTQAAGKAILVVDDEPSVLAVVEFVLRRSGFSVIASSNPRDALRHCLNPAESIDLLLTDVVMPEIEGPRLAELFQQSSPRTKVLFMTGHTCSAIGPGPRGAADVLHKPFTPNELVARVRRALEPARLAARA